MNLFIACSLDCFRHMRDNQIFKICNKFYSIGIQEDPKPICTESRILLCVVNRFSLFKWRSNSKDFICGRLVVLLAASRLPEFLTSTA